LDKIRVLHVVGKMDRAGTETLLMNLYRNIDRLIIQFDFIVWDTERGDYDDEIRSFGGKIFYSPKYNGLNHFKYVGWWKNFFHMHPEYKIIHGHQRVTAALYLYIANKYGLVTIAHSHSISSGTGLKALAKDILQFPIRYVADWFFACSFHAGEWLFGKRICSGGKFIVLKNAIDTSRFRYNPKLREIIRAKLNLTNKLVLTNVGRMEEPKNHKFLIDVFCEFHNLMSNSVLLLIGDGYLHSTLEKKVSDLGLTGSVMFLGTRVDVEDLLHASDAFVFPSLYEGLGIAIIEAQSSGLPCIVSDRVPDEARLTDLFYKLSLGSSPVEWAETIFNCIQNKQRIDRSDEIKAAGYDISETSKWLLEFYIEQYSAVEGDLYDTSASYRIK
jgi:glycosyltransferase involved in cell wall biosynthesis